MAITQYPINGDLAALKAALDATGFFSNTAYDNETTPTKVLCYDADDNLLFEALATGCKVYKSDGTFVSITSNNYGSPVSFYTVGSKAALIHYANAKGQPSACAAFGHTNTGKIGFAIPASFGATSVNANITQMVVAAWDDPGDMTTKLQVADSSAPMVGNSVQFVPIPMHGVYGTPEFLENVYYMPMVQSGMRGLVQEIVASDGKVYFTNGYIAAYDDVGLTT